MGEYSMKRVKISRKVTALMCCAAIITGGLILYPARPTQAQSYIQVQKIGKSCQVIYQWIPGTKVFIQIAINSVGYSRTFCEGKGFSGALANYSADLARREALNLPTNGALKALPASYNRLTKTATVTVKSGGSQLIPNREPFGEIGEF